MKHDLVGRTAYPIMHCTHSPFVNPVCAPCRTHRRSVPGFLGIGLKLLLQERNQNVGFHNNTEWNKICSGGCESGRASTCERREREKHEMLDVSSSVVNLDLVAAPRRAWQETECSCRCWKMVSDTNLRWGWRAAWCTVKKIHDSSFNV